MFTCIAILGMFACRSQRHQSVTHTITSLLKPGEIYKRLLLICTIPGRREALLSSKQETLDSLFQFLNIRNKEQVYGEIIGSEAYRRAAQSSLWGNLVRGNSLSEIQKEKWKTSEGLIDDDVKIIEEQMNSMNILGYELEYADQLPKFSEEEIAEFRRLNGEGKAAKKASLQETDPEDHKPRMLQASVLEKNVVFPEKSEAESFECEV